MAAVLSTVVIPLRRCSFGWAARPEVQALWAGVFAVEPAGPQHARRHTRRTNKRRVSGPAVHTNQPSPPINLPAAVLSVMQK